jgi:hypothetical protein
MRRQFALALSVTLTFVLVSVALHAWTPKPSRTTFSTSARQVTEGTAVTLTATVSAIAPADGVPAGTVEFMDGATSLGTATLADVDGSMQASLAVTLAVGAHPISLKYSGDAIFGGSVSVPETVFVLAQ